MRKATVSIFITAIMLLTLCVIPAAAATPNLDVSIVITTYFPPEGPAYGPFVASGPAVDAGLICPAGDTLDLIARPSGWQSFRAVNYHGAKLFTCSVGGGTFILRLEVRVDPRKGDTANWNVASGTGAYAALQGTGKIFGEYFDGGVTDYVTGKVH